MSLVEANRKLMQAANNPAVTPADRQRCWNALAVSNEPSRPKAQRPAASAPIAARPAVTAPAGLRGMSPEAMLMSVISDPQNSPDEQLRASRALAEYFRDQEITPEHRSQFETANHSMANAAEQRAFVARRFGA
jgi:hypothetical protein